MAQVKLTISKTHDAPTPVPSGQVFTYTIAYSWTGGTGWSTSTPGTLVITDNVPTTLDIISAAPGVPFSTITPPTVTFNIPVTAPAGAGTVQINVRFKPGVTCPGTMACNWATINVKGDQNVVQSMESCVRASAANKWQFWKDHHSGCIVDSGDIVYRITVYNPPGNDIGGLNLTNISLTDVLPPGAIITSVTGNWTGATPTTGTATLTSGPTSLNVLPGPAWYYAYVHVKFPGGTFAAGQVVTNSATLRFQTPCSGGQFLTMTDNATNTLCNPTLPAPGGSLWKWLNNSLYFPSNPWYFPSWSPGCCGSYSVYYYNNGGLTQSGIVINDNLPSQVDVTSVYTHLPPGMTSATMDVFCYVGGACSATPSASVTYTASGTYIPGVLPGPICRVRWTYTGTLSPFAAIYNNIGICVRNNSYVAPFPAVIAGQSINNNVCVTGTNVPVGLCANSNNVVTATAPNILAAKFFEGKAGACMPGCTPKTAGPFYPGDVIRWRMLVTNVGSAAATPCTITDVLPTGFSYVGNETYYYGPISPWSNANNPTCCSLTPIVPSAIGGLSSPAVGATTCTWNFGVLPANCDGSVDYLVIEFDVKVSNNPTVPPGQYFNKFTFSAGNLGTPVQSNPAQVTINGYAKFYLFKDVRQNLTGTTFGPTAGVQAGSQAEFRLQIQNAGMLTLSNIYLLDIMPHVGDISVLPPYTFRNSQYDYPLDMPVPAVAGYNMSYNTSGNTKNPTRSSLFCSTVDPTTGVPPLTPGSFAAAFSPTYSFQIVGQPATTIAPANTQTFLFTATVPAGTPVGQVACNSFGVQLTPYGTTTCLKAESSPACVEVIPPDVDECDSIWGDMEVDDCCTFSTTIQNTYGSIAQLDYNVLPVGGGSTPSGVVQSVSTSPCLPSSTSPSSLAGTTSGSLFFAPPCPNPLGVSVHASSTTASGVVCIELIATFVRADGTLIECRDTFCFDCDPAPQDRCDSMSVIGYSTANNQSGRSFTIYNMKSPTSAICSVDIAVTPHPGSSNLVGGGLVIDGTPQPWPFGTSSGYSQITSAHGLPANTKINFDLMIPYGIGWSGWVTVTVYHCDGGKCEMRYGVWDAGKGGVVVVGSPTDVPDRANLRMHSLKFSRDEAADRGIRSISIRYNDAVSGITAVTAGTDPCDPEIDDCNDIFEGTKVDGRSILIGLRRDLDDPDNQDDPIVTIVYNAASAQTASIEIVYFNANGQEVGYDNVDIDGGEAPGQAVSGLGNRGGQAGIAMAMSSLTAYPNPTTGRCEFGFTLPMSSTVDLELLDARGTKVAMVMSGETLEAGEHQRTVELGRLPSGTYLVSLRVNGVPSVLRLELTK